MEETIAMSVLKPVVQTSADLFGVETFEQLKAVHAARMAAGAKTVTQTQGTAVHGFINAGRWVAKCLGCANYVAVNPHFTGAVCFNCGYAFDTVVFQKDWRDAEAGVAFQATRAAQNHYPKHPATGLHLFTGLPQPGGTVTITDE
jgi:hypothetical protein